MKKLLLASFLIHLMTGCESSKPGVKVTQVVAKVNGDEITSHQVNGELRRMQISVSNHQLNAKILSSLIDRQLLVQEAVKLNVDRTPEVMQLVASAKAQIYAQAYLVRKISAMSPARDQEVNQFMVDHSEVFTHRKIFTMRDIIFANDPHKIDYGQLQASIRSADELKLWLSNNQIAFEVAEESIPTEALPKEALSFVDKIKVDDLLFMRDGIQIIVRCVTNISEAPLQAEQAKTMAIKLVNDHKRQQLIFDEVQRLKKLAKIEVLDASLKADFGAMPIQNESSAARISKSRTAMHGDLKGL